MARSRGSEKFRWARDVPAHGYRGIYINLDRATDRRVSLERQLAELGLADTYVRLPAVDGRTIAETGNLTAGEVGCFRSHFEAIDRARTAGVPTHIIEDDTVLSKWTAPFIAHAIESGMLDRFDVLILDMWGDDNLRLLERLEEHYVAWLRAGGRFSDVEPFDHRGIRFGTASSYVVTPKAAEEMHRLMSLEMRQRPRIQVDSFLGMAADQSFVRVGLTVPTLTTVSAELGSASDVQIVLAETSAYYIGVRRLFFIETDVEKEALPWVRRQTSDGIRQGASPGYLDLLHRIRMLLNARIGQGDPPR